MEVGANVEIVEEQETDEEELQDLDALLEREDIQPDIEDELATQQQLQTILQNHNQTIETPQNQHDQVTHFTHQGENTTTQVDKEFMATIEKPPGIQHREFMLHFRISQDNPNKYDISLLHPKPSSNGKKLKILRRKIKQTKHNRRNFKYTELVRIVM